MAATGKVVGQVEIAGGGDVLHELLRQKSHEIPAMVPGKIHACDLVSGERGAVGSVICWTYTHDGKQLTGKEIIKEVDETNHKIVFHLIEGDLMEMYKVFFVTFYVEREAGNKQLATLTIHFEKMNENVPDPTDVVDMLCGIIKDMDAHPHK